MSTTTFVEALSADPYIRELHRKAVRLLNDPTLDRQQREFHVRRLQAALLEHQAREALKAARLAEKKGRREQASRADRNKGVADQSQVLARRREFALAHQEKGENEGQGPQKAEQPVVTGSDNRLTGRSRPVLTLKRA
jgi:hypothetical protein